MECYWCEKESANLENWGNHNLCPDCVKKYRKDYPDKQKAEFSDLTIREPRLGGGASYGPDTGETKFRGANSDYEGTINHEFMHFILHVHVGLRCCYQFDNICGDVDDYHGFE